MRGLTAMGIVVLLCLLTTGGQAQDGIPTSRGDAIRSLAELLAAERVGDEPIKCGFPVVSTARGRRGSLGGVAAHALGVLDTRPQLDTSIVRSGYRFHFDTTGDSAAALLTPGGVRIPGTALAFAESAAAAIVEVARVELGVLGYPPPPPDGVLGGGPELDIYIVDLGSTYGFVNWDADVSPGTATPSYITIDNDFAFVNPDSNRGIPALQVTMAHEFHHTVQVGCYALWPENQYFYEITSTWLEDVVFTNVNDYYLYIWSMTSQFVTPTVPFASNGLIMYSRGIWGHYVARRFGVGAMKRTWEEISRSVPLVAVDAALRAYGSSLAEAFTEWSMWNYWTGTRADTSRYYREGNRYRMISQIPTLFQAPAITLRGTLAPLSGRYHEVQIPGQGGGADTLTIAVVNANMAGAIAGSIVPEWYECHVSSTRPDVSYKETGAGVFVKFTAADPTVWSIWFLRDSQAVHRPGAEALAEGTVFPNPFIADGSSALSIPVDASASVTGTLQVLDAGMRLVYLSPPQVPAGVGRPVFRWNGEVTGGGQVATGVYLFILSLSDGRTVKGKFAVVRR